MNASFNMYYDKIKYIKAVYAIYVIMIQCLSKLIQIHVMTLFTKKCSCKVNIYIIYMKDISRCTHILLNSFYLNLCITLLIIEIQSMLYLNEARCISKIYANHQNNIMTLKDEKKVWSHISSKLT